MKKKVKCEDCGYTRESLNNYEDYKCPICNNILKENKEESCESDNIEIGEIVETVGIDAFCNSIKTLGKERVWEVIEGFSNPKTRIAYRKLYFKALTEIEN